jgi:prevent-host-death family protein
MNIVGLKEFKQNTNEITERVSKGEKFTVVKRSKPIFSIVSPINTEDTVEWTENYVRENKATFDELALK